MIIVNESLFTLTTPSPTIKPTTSIVSLVNSTSEINDPSSSSTILTIIILSVLSISGWIFMSYALFGRSEAYRTKPDEQFSSGNDSERTTGHDFFGDFD